MVRLRALDVFKEMAYPKGREQLPRDITAGSGVCITVTAAGITSSRDGAVGCTRCRAEQSGRRKPAQDGGTWENHSRVKSICVRQSLREPESKGEGSYNAVVKLDYCWYEKA